MIALSMFFGGTAYSMAQMSHDGHVPGMRHESRPGAVALDLASVPVLTEPGQGAFAALSEVVRILEADSATDWTKVDLDALRHHLRDMDRLVSEAVVRTETLADGLRMIVTGDVETIDTVQRMVPAHATELAKDGRWRVEANRTEDGAMLSVTSDDPAVASRIKGLGFFGLMASQDHHREHHMMIARGQEAHAH